MGVYDNIMNSYDAGVSPTLQDYFQRRALKNVQPNLGYAIDAQMIEQPEHNGKHVHFHRFTELPAITTPLQEGKTPDGQKITETDFSVMTKPYGGFVAITDEFNLNHIDDMTQAISDRLNNQARLTIDTVIRDQITAGLNVMYTGGATTRAGLGSGGGDFKINYTTIKRAVRLLKKKGAQPFADGFYHAKIDHDTYFDLSGDSHWIAVAQYQDDSRVQKYELGTIYKVKFFEVDNGKVFAGESYLYGTVSSLSGANMSGVYNAATRTLTVTPAAAMTQDQARELTGKQVYVQYTKSATNYVTPMCIERVVPGATNADIIFRWTPAASVTDEWTYAQSVTVLPSGAGYNNAKVHCALIYGQDAFGIVKLGGKGAPNIQTIIKPAGSSGSDDPINQRGSLAWKVKHFCAAILQDDFIVRVEHLVSD